MFFLQSCQVYSQVPLLLKRQDVQKREGHWRHKFIGLGGTGKIIFFVLREREIYIGIRGFAHGGQCAIPASPRDSSRPSFSLSRTPPVPCISGRYLHTTTHEESNKKAGIQPRPTDNGPTCVFVRVCSRCRDCCTNTGPCPSGWARRSENTHRPDAFRFISPHRTRAWPGPGANTEQRDKHYSTWIDLTTGGAVVSRCMQIVVTECTEQYC